MFEDDLVPKNSVDSFPAILDDMSVSDLEEYIADLENEISRVKQEISKKQAASNAADAFFK